LKLQIQHMFIVKKRWFLKKKTIHSFTRSSPFNGITFVGMENTQVADNLGKSILFR